MLYPKIGIRPTIDGRWGGIREGLENQTMGMARAAKELIETLKYPDGTPVQAVISPCTIGGPAPPLRFPRHCLSGLSGLSGLLFALPVCPRRTSPSPRHSAFRLRRPFRVIRMIRGSRSSSHPIRRRQSSRAPAHLSLET